MSIRGEITRISSEVVEQSDVIDEILVELVGKAAGSGGITLPTLSDPAGTDEIFLGKEAISAYGSKLTGTFTLSEEISEQDQIIALLRSALAGKAAGSGGFTPTGTLEITENGTYDVTGFATVIVNVQQATAEPSIRYVNGLTSNGSAYFNTNYKPNQNTRVVIDFQAASDSKHLFGARTEFLNKGFLVCWLSDFVYCVQVANSNFNGGVFEGRTRHTVEMTASEFKIDGVSMATYSVDSFQCDHPLYIFSCSNSGANENMSGTLYSVQVYEDNTPILDYRPCLDDNGVACVRDEIAKTYVYSAGSAWTAGEVIA